MIPDLSKTFIAAMFGYKESFRLTCLKLFCVQIIYYCIFVGFYILPFSFVFPQET